MSLGRIVLSGLVAWMGWIGYVQLAAQPTASAVDNAESDSIQRDYANDLPRIAPTESENALDTFEVEPGFRLELAAAEPQVTDPVAMEFDEHGRLFVVEMGGYSEDDDERIGHIRLLEDADRDGRFEKSTLFADGFAWPTALLCYDGGVFVGDAPDILYLKDGDGDGHADERRVVFTGFGKTNVQGLLNSFRWGLDNRIHVAVSSCGAELRRADQADAKPLVLRGRNVSFDPRTLEFEAASGASQHGMCFDPWGRQFTCSNSNHIQQVLVEEVDLGRNPYLRPPEVAPTVAAEGPSADVFRISPVEPWRVIRTRLRKKGIVPGIVEGGGRDAGYFTSATGVTIYTGDAWPAEYSGNAFIGDVGSNLVHRKSVQQPADALPVVARRATPEREFIASRDTWFRPVQFANAPDGNLYVLDMYREVIEHPDSLPPIIKRHLDLTSGRDRGRLYRVASDQRSDVENRQRYSRPLPGGASTDELVAMLGHPNGWHRTTAARLLYERQDDSAGPAIVKLFQTTALAEARVQAIHSLASCGALDDVTVLATLRDQDSRVRAVAVRLAGRLMRAAEDDTAIDSAPLETAIVAAAEDDDLSVRYQVAFALGEVKSPERFAALAAVLARNPQDEYVRMAVHCSLDEQADLFIRDALAKTPNANDAEVRSFLVETARQIGARSDERELRQVAAMFASGDAAPPGLRGSLLTAILQGAGVRSTAVRKIFNDETHGAADRELSADMAQALAAATDDSADLAHRAEAVARLSIGAYADVAPTLEELLEPQQPQVLQVAAVDALGQFAGAAFAEPLLAAWPRMSPSVRQRAIEALLSRAESAQRLLAAVEKQELSATDLDPATVQRLATHPDAAVREQAQRVLQRVGGARATVVEEYRQVLELEGQVDHGRALFREHCSICHRRDGVGTEVGADLATVVGRTPEALAISILDPNREVDPKYLQYTVLTVDGKAVSGMIAAETATSVTLTRAEKVSESVARADIEAMRSTGMSLMPEGFEKVLDQQELADLISFLLSTQ